MDVLSASYNDNTIAVYYNNGLNEFTEQILTTMAVEAYEVFAADVNGDGGATAWKASEF